eukprot:scaffold167571_cov27-Attheya_sp.AAC.1
MQRKITGAGRGGDGGRGRGRGRGPAGGGGGRGRGRGRGRGSGSGRSAKPTVSARKFNDEEWAEFSPEELVEVVRLRDKKKRKRAAAISTIRSVPEEAGNNDGSADEAGTLMKSTLKKKRGRKDERMKESLGIQKWGADAPGHHYIRIHWF